MSKYAGHIEEDAPSRDQEIAASEEAAAADDEQGTPSPPRVPGRDWHDLSDTVADQRPRSAGSVGAAAGTR